MRQERGQGLPCVLGTDRLSPGGGEGRGMAADSILASLGSQVDNSGLPVLDPEASLAHPMSAHSEQPAFPVQLLCYPSTLLPLQPWGLLFSSPWSLPVVGPLTDGVRGCNHHPPPGRAGLGCTATWRWPCPLQQPEGKGVLTSPSLSGCVSTPSGPRFRRNTFSGRAASPASQPQQRNRGAPCQAHPHAH